MFIYPNISYNKNNIILILKEKEKLLEDKINELSEALKKSEYAHYDEL